MRDILGFIRVTKRNFSVLACKPFLADMLVLESPGGWSECVWEIFHSCFYSVDCFACLQVNFDLISLDAFAHT